MKRIAPLCLTGAVLLLPLPSPALAKTGGEPIDSRKAGAAFSELKKECDRDGGRLWGKPICGPVMLVEPNSRALVANERPGKDASEPVPGVFMATYPPSQPISNTAIEWNGQKWAQLAWPLPADSMTRRIALAHESFHRIQEEVGVPLATMDANAHLDTQEGRRWLRLEWRALERALGTKGAARKQALEDALAFREARRKAFPSAAKEECMLELGEGLAQYTGIKLATSDAGEQKKLAINELHEGAARPSFVRSFAYASGPAYGLLLDEIGMPWRSRMASRADLGTVLAQAMTVSVPAPSIAAIETTAKRYGGEQIQREEQAREAKRAAGLAEHRRNLVEGPVLRLPLQHTNLTFDPRGLVPFGPKQTVYPKAQIMDDWGTLEARGPVLIDREAKTVSAPSPQGGRQPLAGPGWTLALEPGWKVVPDKRPGDFRVVKQE